MVNFRKGAEYTIFRTVLELFFKTCISQNMNIINIFLAIIYLFKHFKQQKYEKKKHFLCAFLKLKQ